jgi:NADH-quinone oxidoreductase subunit G
LCDKGRFGHKFVNEKTQVPRAENIQALDKNQTYIGIGSPRASLEANYALKKLVGAENFYDGHTALEHRLLSKIMEILAQHPETASLEDVRNSDAVFILGEDLTQTAPMLALSIRQNLHKRAQEGAAAKNIPEWNDLAVRNAQPDLPPVVYLAHDTPTKLDSLVTQKISSDLEDIQSWLPILKAARNPVIIAGTSLGSEPLIKMSIELRKMAPQAKLCYVLPAANSFGLSLLKPSPFAKPTGDKKSTAIILENNLPAETLAQFDNIIAIDFLETETTKKANLALGCGSFAETTGSMVNNEGRAQRYYSVFERREQRPESWRILRDLGGFNWVNLDDLCSEMSQELPVLEPFFRQVHNTSFRIDGQKIARQSQEFSGRTSMYTHISMHEQAPMKDPDSPLVYSMEGYHGDMPPDLASSYWRPGWNSVSALNTLSHATSGVKLKPI